MKHSNIVGGSTAKRVLACPGSVALCAAMPEKPSSKYADEGTLLHDTIADILNDKPAGIGIRSYEGITLTQDLYDEKVAVALALLDEVDPNREMIYEVEQRVEFDEDIFGSTDLIGRIGDKAIILDWKFGNGVAVEAEENEQGLFYAAAAMMTPATKWAFDGAQSVEIVIVQPPMIKRWVTTPERVVMFRYQLMDAVKAAMKAGAALNAGEHCRWCAAKPTCPKMTGAVDRAIKTKLEALPPEQIGKYLANAELLDQWITDLRLLALNMLESGVKVPGYKLVAKRATRSWLNEADAKVELLQHLNESEVVEKSVISPAKAEKLLKKQKIALPGKLVTSISSGNTLADWEDPRPEVVQIGQTLLSAINKLN